jgi:eukaryotic-like serine/threonine-protein kinase
VRLAPGTRVGPYEVVATLGTGGMAEVYRARDTRLQREVALKVVGEALAGDAGFLARLEQEARLAGSLNHPNIVAVHDVGSHDGTPYIVSELLQGETLRDRLKRGAIPLSSALDWAAQIAQGLAAAHEHGIVHRDLKPENVFLTRSGHVKLLDFGIAKAAAPVTSTHGLLEATLTPGGAATRTGGVLGTPGFMSPEQVRGEPLDGRSDIFSLGCILYELLSGQRAFKGGSVVESGHAILHDDPAPLPDSVPAPVVQIVGRCLQKEPEQRFQSARDVAFSLEAMRTARSITPTAPLPPTGTRPRRPLRRLAWGGALLLLGAIAFAAGRASRPPATPGQVRQLTFRRGAVFSARFAPDGHTVHFSAAWTGGPPEAFTTSVDSTEMRPLALGPAQVLAVSRSGELAVTLRVQPLTLFDGLRGTLARVSPLGGRPRELANDVEYADWAPDGENLAAVRTDGTGSRLEYPLGRVLFRSTGWVSHPRVSAAGDRVAFIDHPFAGDTAGLVMVVGRDGKAEAWSPQFVDALGLVWGRSADEVLVTAAVSGDLSALWKVRPGKVPRLVHREAGNLLINDLSRDGRVLMTVRDWRQEVAVVKAGDPPRSLEWLDWASVSGISDDGNEVLSSESGTGAGGGVLITLRNLDQAAPAQLGRKRALDLSPDGKWVLATDDDQSSALHLLPAGPGTGRTMQLPGIGRVDAGAFLRDGKRLALLVRRGSEKLDQLMVFNTESGEMRMISPLLPYSIGLATSLDDRWVAMNDSDGVLTAFPVAGGTPLKVPELGPTYQIAGWLRDGTMLAFDRYTLPAPVVRFDPKTRAVTPVTHLAPADVTGVPRITKVRVTPDGKTFAFHHRRVSATLYVMDLDLTTR